MGVGSMGGRLHPLVRGGSMASRSADVPALVTPRLTNAASYFEDFVGVAVAAERFGETPPNLYGHPAYEYRSLNLGGGTVGLSGSTSAFGVLQLAPASGGGFMVSTPGRNTTTGGAFAAGAATKSVGMWRWAFGGTSSNRIEGIGWVRQSLATSTDWVTDPDTALATTDAFLVTRNSSAYSGDTAGDMVMRVYSTGGTDNDSLLLKASGSQDTNYHKLEIAFDGAGSMRWYWDGTLVWTKTLAALADTVYRPVIGIVPAAASKIIQADCLYQEVGFSTAR